MTNRSVDEGLLKVAPCEEVCRTNRNRQSGADPCPYQRESFSSITIRRRASDIAAFPEARQSV